jgi:hypothetical protein
VPLALLFPEGGYEPFPIRSFAAVALVTLLFLWALPPRERLLRTGGVVYLLACACALVIHTPMGSNIERYAVLLAGPLLLCATAADRRLRDRGGVISGAGVTLSGSAANTPTLNTTAANTPALTSALKTPAANTPALNTPAADTPAQNTLALKTPAPNTLTSNTPTPTGDRSWGRVIGGTTPALVIALLGIALFTIWGPVRETKAVAGNESTQASYYTPVLGFLARNGGALKRVEVPLTRSHWEAALMAPSVSLARGWEKQLDERDDSVLLAPGLTAAGYSRWLHEEAVSYVALPDTPLDPSSAGEGRLIRRGLPYLKTVFKSKHWTVYAVRDPTPLLEGSGRLASLGHDSFALFASAPGRFLVRVRYTPFWTITEGGGRVTEAPGGWTYVTADRPGQLQVAARFSFARAFG